MTQQERQMLLDLANKVAQTPAPQRDPEAEELIRTRIGSRPDALYLMTQTVLIQNLALDHAKQQIQELQSRAAQPPPQHSGASMLGQAQGTQAAAPPAPSQTSGQSAFPMPQPAGAGPSSFLRSAASTAAGVAAGALAFEGIRSLFGGVEHLFGSVGQGAGFMGGGLPPSETIVNNYYDSPDAGSTDTADDNSPDTDDSDRNDSGEDDRADSDDSLTDDSYTDDSSSGDDLV